MYCSACGAEASTGLNYCSRCGADLPSNAVDEYAPPGDDGTGYIAMALGFSVCAGIAGLVFGAIRLAQLSVDGFGVGVFSIACAGMVLSIAHMIVQLMKANIAARGGKSKPARRDAHQAASAPTRRSLDEHRETIPPFPSVTEHTTRIFEPASQKPEV